MSKAKEMNASLNNIDETIASEKYESALNSYYNNKFHALIEKMRHVLPSNRVEIIKNEMIETEATVENDCLEAIKYLASLSVLVDLSLQGWIFDIQDNSLTLKMEIDNVDDKQKIRYRLSAEKNAQFKTPSVAAFIKQMETSKTYRENNLSIKNLIGDKNLLLQNIRNGNRVCKPYIQMVTNERDDLTGYKLSDIWRYFRYTWSIPYKTMPGRNLFYLVRDRLQP